MSTSPLESNVFTATRDPEDMFFDLAEHLHRQARIEFGSSWPLVMAASFEMQRTTREMLVDADPRGDSAKDELTKLYFSGATDSDGRTGYNLSLSISTTSNIKEVPIFHLPHVYACLATTSHKLIERALSDPANSFEPIDDPLDIDQCSAGFMKAMSAHIIKTGQLSFRDWTEYEYGLDEAAMEFWYREREGYEINGSRLVVSEYASDESDITDEYVHGLGLDDNDEEIIERRPFDVDEDVDKILIPIDASEIVFDEEFVKLIEGEFKGEEIMTTPFHLHALRVVQMINTMRNSHTFSHDE